MADYSNPQSLNRYSYAYNNPVRYSDPSGYSPSDYRRTYRWEEGTGNLIEEHHFPEDEIVVKRPPSQLDIETDMLLKEVYSKRQGEGSGFDQFMRKAATVAAEVVPVGALLSLAAPYERNPYLQATGQGPLTELGAAFRAGQAILGFVALSKPLCMASGVRGAMGGTTLATKSGLPIWTSEQNLLVHFGKHAGEMMKRSGMNAYTVSDYFLDAQRVIRTGTPVIFERGKYAGTVNFVRYAGQSKGRALIQMVGLNKSGRITTYTFKRASQLDKWGMRLIP